MEKRFVMLFAAALAVVLVCGCTISRGAKKDETPKVAFDKNIPADREEEGKAAAEKMARGMEEALKTGDFEKFNAVQPKQGRLMPESAFVKRLEMLRRNNCTLVGIEYMGCFRQGKFNYYLWKFRFESRKKDEAAVSLDKACWVRVGFVDGKPVLSGFILN